MPRTVRLAGREDTATLARLNRPVQRLHARLYPALFKPEADESAVAGFFADILAEPDNTIGICEEGGAALGYIWIERQHRAETPFTIATSRLYIHHLSVAEEARRQGVASALLDWAIGRAREDGIEVFVLDHWAANGEAHGFFARHGFSAERIGMRKAGEL